MTTTTMNANISIGDVYSKLRAYNGNNHFMLSLKSGLIRYGKLTEKQLPHAVKFFEDLEQQTSQSATLVSAEIIEVRQYPVYVLKNPCLIILKGQFFVKQLCEDRLSLGEVISYAWVVSEVTGLTDKAVRVKAKIADSKHNLNFCRACGRSLTDKFSIATGMGKVCSDRYGIEYIKDLADVEKFKLRLDDKINEIGEKEFWLPKSKIENFFNLKEEIDNSTTSLREEEKIVETIHFQITKEQIVSNICDKLMNSSNCSFSVLSEENAWKVVFLNEEFIGSFNDCSKLFLERFNNGNDCSLTLIADNSITLNKSNIK